MHAPHQITYQIIVTKNEFHFFKYMFRYVIECPKCGVIYRSRQYWYGNQDPVDTVVRTEIQHVWPGVSDAKYLIYLSDADYISLICIDLNYGYR